MWSARGYNGNDETGKLIGSLSRRTAVIVGSGPGVLDELTALNFMLRDQPVIFAVNAMGRVLEDYDHWVSLHPETFQVGRPRGPTHTAIFSGADYSWHLTPAHLTLSGYFAMQVAWLMGAGRIILCGCPGEGNARFDGSISDSPGFQYGAGRTPSDANITARLDAEMRRLPVFKSIVRSMSGWTERYFGGLTNEHDQLGNSQSATVVN